MTLVERAALVYGVRVLDAQAFEGHLPSDFAWGPIGHGCAPSGAFVLTVGPRHDPMLDDPHHVFHEVTHVITHPPFASLDEFYEDFVQLPFERALADALGDPDPDGLRLLHQQTPHSEPWRCDVERTFEQNDLALTQTAAWQAGVAVGQAVGILDAQGRALLGRWPRWGILSAERWVELFAMPACERIQELRS
jgi:hypothetical protein